MSRGLIMKCIISVNPFDCRMWDMHDRLDALVTEGSCKSEIESFAKHGQLIPVLGRPLPPDGTHKYELIYGARRLFVARHLNIPLLLEVRPMSDREGLIAMDIENRQRADISPYERGLSYASSLRKGYFRSQEDLARALRISKSQVSRLVRLAQLPPVVVSAFASPSDIHETWGLDLMQALEDAQRRPALIRAARRLSAAPRPPAPEVYRLLMSPVTKGRRLRRAAHDEVIKDDLVRPLFRIRRQRSSIAFLFPIETAPPEVFAGLRIAVRRVLLQRAAPSRADLSEPAHEPYGQRAVEGAFACTSSTCPDY